MKDIEGVTQDNCEQNWNDAEVIGNLDSPEARTVLDSKIEYMSARSRNTPGSEWRHRESTVGDLHEKTMTKHPESGEKDANPICYATAPVRVANDRDTLEEVRHTSRIKSMIESVTVIAIDVDGTAKVELIRDRLIELGLFAVIYTTHSHAAKSTPKGDRFRVIIFLTEPFRFPEWKKERLKTSRRNKRRLMSTPRITWVSATCWACPSCAA